MPFSESKIDTASILLKGSEDIRAERVWLLLNVMFATWAFFCAYFIHMEYWAPAKVCAGQFFVFVVIRFLLHRKKDFLLVMHSYLLCSGTGIFFVSISHPSLWLTIFFFPVSILVASNLFGMRQAWIWFAITCGHFVLSFFYRYGVAGTFSEQLDPLMISLGTAFCVFFCCQQAEASYQGKTKGLLDLSHSLQEKSDELRELATTDSLTGLMNRFQFQNELAADVKTATSQQQVALFLVDMDGFKEINDTLGHAKGDQVLVEVGNRLSVELGHRAHVARLGGDEFCVLFSDIEDQEKAEQIGWEIHNLLIKRYDLIDIEATLGTSVGYALSPQDAANPTEVLSFADTAMYHAKRNRLGVVRYQSEMTDKLRANRVINERLTSALEQDEFHLAYQPLFDGTGEMFAAEALLRWERDGEKISPAHFVPMLEASGRIVPVSKWVIQEACRQLGEWRQRGAEFVVSINVSPLQFKDDDFVGSILRPIEKYGIPPSKLELEITEGILIDNVDQAIEKLLQVKELGCRISIDDFGTGYSSLAYLRQFPLDKLKIDRAFVKDIPDADDGVIAKSIIMLADHLGLEVVAEGIETVEQLDFLKQNGCNKFQGFLFSRPAPPDEILGIAKQQLDSMIRT